MKIAGCDLHTRYQQMAMLDSETGELIERWVPQVRPSVRLTWDWLRFTSRIPCDAEFFATQVSVQHKDANLGTRPPARNGRPISFSLVGHKALSLRYSPCSRM